MQFSLAIQVEPQSETIKVEPGTYYGRIKDNYDNLDGEFCYKIVVIGDASIDFMVVNLDGDKATITLKNEVWFPEHLPFNIKKILAKREGTEMIEEKEFYRVFYIALERIHKF